VLLEIERADADCLIALGDGSTTGLSNAIAMRSGLPQVVIPTTYAGPGATPVLGQTGNGHETALHSLDVWPEVIVYDVDLTMGLPVGLSVVSGFNAMAHAIESLYAPDANPLTSALAELGIRALARSLPIIAADPKDAASRSDALFGAWAWGTCLGIVGMSLHHKLCHTLGGSFHLPHAETHAVILPHAAAFNTAAAPEALARAAHALQVDDAATHLYDLAKRLDAPTSLHAIGMREADLDKAADLAIASPYWNPRPLDRAAIRALLDDAFFGRRPAA